LGAELNLAVDPTLDELLRRDAPLIMRPAAERVRDELIKLLDTPRSAAWLRYMDATGLLTRIFPELEPARGCDQPRVHFLPVLEHCLETVAALEWMLGQLGLGNGDIHYPPSSTPHPPSPALPVAVQTFPNLSLELLFADKLRVQLAGRVGGQSQAALLKLAALLHDNAKPQTRQLKPDGGVSFYDHQNIGADVARGIARRLRLSRAAAAYVEGVVRAHMRPGQLRTQELTRRAVVRLFRDTGGATEGAVSYGPDVLLHELADHMATRGPLISVEGWHAHLAWTGALLEVHWGAQAAPPPPLLNGEALMAALGIGPGPLVGELLREVREAQAAGEITSTDEALALVRRSSMKEGE
jgi:poly(A) polymerase/tRNA nucleotidyltransferase (CCA-adding enzyme)